ncbi:DUF3313 family protein [Oceanicoccus sp. KOV_DT_Chl]|uniref:DUF3313 family protein n=1 Tax=Oceanicoccus sp. KOV_DT_Chl TaxID=1904639 RepID=UPI000C7C27C5|nr:DUF3313 family protein [Oceanicoccus sp. KOV_DT_Chl]
MTINNRVTLAIVAVAAILSACSMPAALQTGADAEVSYDGLTKVDHTVLDDVWMRADADLSQYDQVIFQTAEVSYKPVRSVSSIRSDQSEFPMDDKQKERFLSIATESFTSGLAKSEKFTVASAAGPNVLLIKSKLQDVVSNVPPRSVGRTEIFVSEVGSATLVLELYDSQSGTILARAIDKGKAEGPQNLMRANSITSWREVKQMTDSWAAKLRRSLDSLMLPNK